MASRPPIPRPELWSLGDLERLRLILRGGSVIDWRRLHFVSRAAVDDYLRLCMFEPDDPFDRARLQRLLDQAVDYLRTTFGYAVAPEVAAPRELHDLFLLASGVGEPKRLRRIACVVLKVMHVVHHVEARGLLHRTRLSEDELAQLCTARVDHAINQLRAEGLPIVAAEGSVKTRHSTITKLLAKKETLAAAIYDRVRYRVVAAHREDVLPLLVRLCDLLLPFNFVVPGQTQNTLFSFRSLVQGTANLKTLAPQLQSDLHLEEDGHDRDHHLPHAPNEFTSSAYRVLNFVVDLPVRLPEGLIADPAEGRIAFCWVELQLVDEPTARANELGETAHVRYKRRQLSKVLRRLSRGLVVPRKAR
jgi:uncharacterized protein (TIGR04552 family)